MKFNLPIKLNKSILALGSEFETRLAFYYAGEVVFSENTGEIAQDFEKLEKFILDFVKTHCNASLPDIIITDLHPLYNSCKIGKKLAKQWKIQHIEVQHHIAHVFSAIADSVILNTKYIIQDTIYGIACDGTGYGLDGNIWGGEVFKISLFPPLQRGIKGDFLENGEKNRNLIKVSSLTHGKIPPAPPFGYRSGQALWERVENIYRIGHLEEQYLLGGELAIREPARMLISILSKFLSKDEVFKYVKKYYSAREFNLLWNQLEQKFNCPLSSSAGRVLDAVSVLLGFCENGRKYKHYPIEMLEKNSAVNCGEPRLKPKITKNENGEYILNTTELFKYLIENFDKDNTTPLTPCLPASAGGRRQALKRGELGFVAQRYIIEGLYNIARNDCVGAVFFSGGLAENKIMREFAGKNSIYVSDKIPSGDAGIAMGQIMYYTFYAWLSAAAV